MLYEMVTGRKAFQGKSHSSLAAAILTAGPPPIAVKPFTPPWLEQLLNNIAAAGLAREMGFSPVRHL